MPLVIGLHFYPGTAVKMREMTALDAKADQHGFLTAYPQGTDGGFNALVCCGEEDDVAFLKALTEELIANRRADPDRVYLTGISNGSDLETYVVKDMGHLWPGAKTGQLADPNAPIVATDIVWDFFAAHPRR